MATKTKTVNHYQDQATGTIEPTGLSVSRSGGTFTLQWKVGDENYGAGQWVTFAINDGPQAGEVSVNKSITSFSVDAGQIRKIAFWVCGKREEYKTSSSDKKTSKKKKNGKTTKTVTTTNTTVTFKPDRSAWAYIEWVAAVPAAPTLNYSRTTSSSGTFSWSAKIESSGKPVFSNVELQTCTSRTAANPPGSGWSSRTVSETGNQSYTESLTNGNVVRWVRVRSRGPAGASAWVYAHHAYGNPATPRLTGASAVIDGAVTRVTATWNGAYSLLNPIDNVTLQYAVDVPTTSNLSAPSTGWSDSVRVGGNGGNDKIIANISEVAGTDECMWVRVKASHDDFETYSAAVCVYKGSLATPGSITVNPNVSTGNVVITITENTNCDVAGTVIFYRSENRPNYDQIVAVLNHGETSVTVNIPEIKTGAPKQVNTTCFGAYAYVGSHNGLSVSALMKSGTITRSTLLARPPAWLRLTEGPANDRVRIGWPWTWTTATNAELAWADHDDAWESTDEPQTYDINDSQISSWIIASLGVGKKWFFRVRLIYRDDDVETIGPWSEMYSYDLSSAPNKPVLILNKRVIHQDGILTARWVFVSEDETSQSFADIYATTDANTAPASGALVAHVTENQTVEIKTNWQTGETYYFYLRVTSSAGRQSVWSDAEKVYVANPIAMNIQQTSLTVEDGINYLTEMPFTVTVSGAGVSGKTIVSIIRAEDYHIFRPDDSEIDGYAGETIASFSQAGESQVTLTTDDLVGSLDDGAKYILRCTVVDEYDQRETEDIEFIVRWTHQAGKPKAEIEIDEWQKIAIITPIAPDNYEEGDVCDIYRISADKPELIVKGAEFGTSYVDPYPAFGAFGGHRIVTRTANGDYITEENQLAWYHANAYTGDSVEESSMVIDVAGEQIYLPYNIELQNVWTKDFKRTTYLGGAVQGDWNPAVTRDLSANTVILRGRDVDVQLAMRNLAGYAGIAHIRTPDGSSMAADIQVRETYTYQSKRVSYSLTVKVIDPDEPEGMTLDEWAASHPVDE